MKRRDRGSVMNKNNCKKTYLGFINPLLLIGAMLPDIGCFIICHLLGIHDTFVFYLGGFCGCLGYFYAYSKLSIDVVKGFINLALGGILVLFLLQLIKFLTGVMIYGY